MAEPAASAAAPRVGFVGRIPVRNLWLLMLYASELFQAQGRKLVAEEKDLEDTPDLVAEILAHAVEHRLRRSLSLGYQPMAAELGRVRGRIDLLRTERTQSMRQGRVHCRFEDLTVDTPRNRLARAALASMARIVGRAKLRHRCARLERALAAMGVKSDASVRRLLALARPGRHEAQDRTMLAAARLAIQLALPTEETGASSLPAPSRDEVWARILFEKAVAGFYAVVLGAPEWRVDAQRTLEWPVESRSAGIDRLLPAMRADIVIDDLRARRRTVVDTKFTTVVTRGWHREESLKSAHIYQLYAYLRSQEGGPEALAARASGLLLYPAVGADVDERVVIQGHEIRFATIDLAATAKSIRQGLLAMVE